MKAVIRCWTTSKKALVELISASILYVIQQICWIRFIVVMTNVLSKPEQLYSSGIWYTVGFCVVAFISGRLCNLLKKYATHDCYSANCNLLADKLLSADVRLFMDNSCAKMATIQGAISDLCGAGWYIALVLTSIMQIGTVIISLIEIAGWAVVPVATLYLVILIAGKFIYPNLHALGKKVANITTVRNQEMEDIVYGFMEVRTLDTKEYHRDAIRTKNAERVNIFNQKARLGMAFGAIVSLVDNMALIVAVMICTKLIISGQLTVASGVAICALITDITDPLMLALDIIDDFSTLVGHGPDFLMVMDCQNSETSGDLTISDFKRAIEIQDLSFSYKNTDNTLDHINMRIEKGQHIGICGETGGGKSTLFKLINKLYKPQSGFILIDGTDIFRISDKSYRRLLGSVQQENIMFPGTIWKNVTYGAKYASEYKVVEACEKAHIYEFISGLPDKFQTEIGPRGLILSAGQRQRIALARLFLRNPEIILLDEATSALDNDTEAFVQDAIEGLHGKTIITIAHRLSTIVNCDRIYVLEDHHIVEHGTHEELMQLRGSYYRMSTRASR